ncbi:class I SAM-dependent methyltransferase [Candidatus Pelagibacter sp.]|nr:class I SAM-dependent methyltransferase [Candidatus Pelagibacter sp.]
MKKVFLNLLKQPITNSYLPNKKKSTLKNEFFYNLSIAFDTNNYLVSIKKPVNPKKQYTDQYAHRASQSKTMNLAFEKTANKLKKKYKPKLSLEIGSNDGVFIKNFNKKNILAVEPCKNLARITNKKGFLTYDKFWDIRLSKKIIKEKGKLSLIYSANTISHIPNLKETFKAISISLEENGVFVFEDPYIGSVLKHNSYDQFYDEHVHLFSFIAISNIVKKENLKIIDVEILKTHGGSIRFYVAKKNSKYKPSKNVDRIYKSEIKMGLNKLSAYKNFANRVKKSKQKLLELLKKLKKGNKKVISYGATYKSATIFNYCNIGPDLIEFVTDSTKNKQGKYTPGKHIPIIPPLDMVKEKIDYAFLGAWNFLKEIKEKEKKFTKNGGKFITHVPTIKII